MINILPILLFRGKNTIKYFRLTHCTNLTPDLIKCISNEMKSFVNAFVNCMDCTINSNYFRKYHMLISYLKSKKKNSYIGEIVILNLNIHSIPKIFLRITVHYHCKRYS